MTAQGSLSVSGSVAMTATRSSGLVTSLKSTRDVLILQVRLSEGRLANDVGKPGRGVGEQPVAVGEQEVELAITGDFERQFMNGGEQFAGLGCAAAEALAQALEQPGEGALAVGQADR